MPATIQWNRLPSHQRFHLVQRVLEGEPGLILIDGIEYRYQVFLPSASTGATRQIRLYRGLDPFTSESVYDLIDYSDYRLECDCGDWMHRHAEHGTMCKHLHAAHALGLWLDCPVQEKFSDCIDNRR